MIHLKAVFCLKRWSAPDSPPFSLASFDESIYKRCNNEYYTRKYQGEDTGATRCREVVVIGNICCIDFSYLFIGDTNCIYITYNVAIVLASSVGGIAETEPMFSIVKLISRGSFYLLHIVENMLTQNDTFNNIGFKKAISVFIGNPRGN